MGWLGDGQMAVGKLVCLSWSEWVRDACVSVEVLGNTNYSTEGGKCSI